MEGACSELSLINLSCLIPFPTEVILGALGYEKEKKKKRMPKAELVSIRRACGPLTLPGKCAKWKIHIFKKEALCSSHA